MNKLIDKILPEDEQHDVKFRQLTTFLITCQVIAVIFAVLRISISGFTVGAAPSIVASMVVAILILGIRTGLSLKSVTILFGSVIFTLMLVASMLNGGLEGPLFHLNVLSLLFFPYFLDEKLGLKLNAVLIVLAILVEWGSLQFDFTIMRLDGDGLLWASRSFFIVRLTIFVAVIKILIPQEIQESRKALWIFGAWIAWVLIIFIADGQIEFWQSFLYPIIFYMLPKLDWEFQVVFIAANISLGFLYMIQFNNDWMPGVSIGPQDVLSNFAGIILSMVLILAIQVRDFLVNRQST